MVVNFDIFDRVRTPEITLCNPMGQQLYILSNLKNKKAILRYNAVSEFTFEATNTINDEYNEYFDYLQSTRIINVEFVGSFIITKVIEVDYGMYKTKQVQCKSLEYEMSYKGVYLEQGTYKFYDPMKPENTIMNEIMSLLPDWRIGSVDSDLWNLYRTFDVIDKNLYDFTMNDVEEAFECIFIFDTLNKTVSAKTTKNAVVPSDIYFSDRNVIKQLSLEEDSEQLKTALNVYGADDLSIASVNPFGGNTIYDFSYFKNDKWMTSGLINALTTWENKVKSTTNNYATNLTELKKLNGELISLKTTHTEYKNELAALEAVKAVKMEQGLDLTEINNQIDAQNIKIANHESLIVAKEAQIKAIKDSLVNVNNSLSFESNFTQEQYTELSKFIKVATYQNDAFVVTDSMSDVQKQDIVQELYDVGLEVLKRVSSPKLTFNIESINFLNLIDYKDMSRELNLGSEITIDMKEKGFAYPVLLELEIDYDNYDNLRLGFGNRLRLDKSEYSFSDLFKDTVNTSSDVSFNKGKWGEGIKAKNQMNEFLNSSLNASVQDIVNSDNQDILIDGSGIRCRRMNPDTGQYDPEQLWITGKSMVLSDDAFQTAKTAIGRIKLPDGTYSYGINAEILMSKIVATSQLIIENEGGTFRVDADGVTLINAKLIIRNENGESTIEDELNKKAQTFHSEVAPMPPQHNPKVGDIWYNTAKNNLRHRYDGIQWIEVEYTGVNSTVAEQIQGALDKITDVESKADGKVEIFYSETDPSINTSNQVKYGDLWVDISKNEANKPKNKMYRRTNSNTWESIEDSSISDIFGQLGNMESAIDGKVTTYYCPKAQLPPDSQLNEGDLWVDTSNNNKLMIRHGVYWVDVSIMGESAAQDWATAMKNATEALEKADQALALEDKMIHTFYQSTEPSGAKVGDLWLNTATGRVCIYTSLGWKESQDKTIIDAVNKAQEAMDKADSKITTYYQDTMPTVGELGDLWIHTGRNNEVFVHNGSTFVKTMGDLQDKVDDLITSVHDAYFDYGQKYWSEQYNGQIVESTNVGTITSDGISGSKAWKIQGQHSIYTKNAIPVDKERTYKFTFKIKQLTHAKTEYPLSQWFERTLSNMGEETFWNLTWFLSQEMKIKVGVVCLDKSFKTIGSPKYFIANEKLLSLNDGWITLTANISGYGNGINQFADGTLYMRPTFVVNYPNGDGEVLVDSFSVVDITEAKTAQDTADNALGKIENVLTVEGNLNTSKLEGTLNAHANQILAGTNMQLQIDKDGIWAMNDGDKNTATKVVAMNENGIVMAKERVSGQLNWRTAISPLGINADEINTGKLRALDILGCNLEVSNEKSKILLNPTDGIKIQKKSGSIWKDTLYIDGNGDAMFKGSINVNDRFTVNTFGDVVANSIKIAGTSELDAKDMVVRNLVVGGNVTMGANATISWEQVTDKDSVADKSYVTWENTANKPADLAKQGDINWSNLKNKPSDLAYQSQIPDEYQIRNITQQQLSGVYGMTTQLGATYISSPNISGGTITGAIVQTTNNYGAGICMDTQSLRLYSSGTNLAGMIHYDTDGAGTIEEARNRLLIKSNDGYALKLQSGGDMSISARKLFVSCDTQFSGRVTDGYGNPIGGKAVFS